MRARDGFWRFIEMASEDFASFCLGEDAFARGEEISEASDGVEVSPWALVAREVEDLLGGHVSRCSCDGTVWEFLCSDGFCDAEVGKHDAREIAVVHEEDIAGLDISVDDVSGVRVRERVEEFEQQEAHLQPRQGRGRLWQRAACRELHGVVLASGDDLTLRGVAEFLCRDAVIEDADDGRMVQASDSADLVRERLPEILVLGTECCEDFDGDRLAELSVDGFPDDAHGTFSDRVDEIEWTD